MLVYRVREGRGRCETVEGGGGRRAIVAGRAGVRTLAFLVLLACVVLGALAAFVPRRLLAQTPAPARLDRGRFTVVAYPSDLPLARSLLRAAVAHDTFPGLARPSAQVLIAIAPDARRFREWVGPFAPEWGAAIAMPDERRVVMQGRRASSEAGDPLQVLRHELAHLALHEALGDLPTRWFDEGYAGYAAGEWGREEVLATSVALVLRGTPTLDSLESSFYGGAARASAGYALAYRAVTDLATLDRERGLALFFRYWKETESMDRAMRAAYGVTLASFEMAWRARTVRRYGALALFADLSLAAAVLMALVLPLYISRRRRDRRRMAALVAADEAADRAARESALEELLRSVPPETNESPPPPSVPPQLPS
ncbi:MAG: hypothetical protein WKG32_00470 [Gemmatimonadaceae bacterium]